MEKIHSWEQGGDSVAIFKGDHTHLIVGQTVEEDGEAPWTTDVETNLNDEQTVQVTIGLLKTLSQSQFERALNESGLINCLALA